MPLAIQAARHRQSGQQGLFPVGLAFCFLLAWQQQLLYFVKFGKQAAAGAAQDAGSAASSGGMFPEVIARVNGQPISGRELEILMRRELASIGNPEWNALRAEYRTELLYSGVTTLINARLIYEKAVSSGAKPTEAELDAELQNFAKNYSSDAEMNAALARQFISRDSLKQRLEQDLTITKYLNSLTQTVVVTPEEISKYYAENPDMFAHPDLIRASHILLLSEENADLDAQVKERAESLLARAKKGEDFAKLAKENSVDSTASEGGDIGYVTKEVLESDFANVVFSMSVGEIRLVKSRYGYHVVKLTDKKPEGVAKLDEIREDLTAIMKQQKSQAELAKLLGELQEKAKIEILVSPGE
jgi:parvulin-like peptidyl-prolyl isomerase